jgi:hypothetical protein
MAGKVKCCLKNKRIAFVNHNFYRIPEEKLRVKRKNILPVCTILVIVHLDRAIETVIGVHKIFLSG